MRFLFATVLVELFFEQFINGFIDIEGWTIWPCNFEPDIQPKTARTLLEKLNFAP